MDSNEPIVSPCFLYSNSFVFPISGVSKKLPTLEKMRKGMSVSVIDTDETQYSQEENNSKPSPSPTTTLMF